VISHCGLYSMLHQGGLSDGSLLSLSVHFPLYPWVVTVFSCIPFCSSSLASVVVTYLLSFFLCCSALSACSHPLLRRSICQNTLYILLVPVHHAIPISAFHASPFSFPRILHHVTSVFHHLILVSIHMLSFFV